ncbi:uncharacterized protein Fot_02003 [Forsythia ovata]|uniref:Uncharacterized protein n=1 Tax=Forsythia ovata TaxID=205694 RepID=A0ABD1X5L4_9LAMI
MLELNPFSSNDMNSDIEKSRIVDDTRRLRIQSEKTGLDSENANISSSSYRGNSDVFSNVNLCGKDQSVQFSSSYNGDDKKSDDERVASELPDEMRKLNIGSANFSTVYDGNGGAELPNNAEEFEY